MNNIPRNEYPRPQFVRKEWINLNGWWQFEFDDAKTGRERGLCKAEKFSKKILVPFCPESTLSGISDREFHSCVWYRREFSVPDSWKTDGKRIIVNFEACDYYTEVYVNGKSVGSHRGGMTPFSFDITDFLNKRDNIIIVCAEDDNRDPGQPSGKQSNIYYSNGASYTRTTGIWQTVWLEIVPESYIISGRYTPFIDTSSIHIEVKCKNANNMTLSATAMYRGKIVGKKTALVYNNTAVLDIELNELHLWDIDVPELYDLELSVGKDSVYSYFGMRNIDFTDHKFLLNGKKVFQRLVLDQGYYPDGVMTAPSDEELRSDILRSKKMGFNGARLHQKIFERRFLYHCDKEGYIVWNEFYDWGLDTSRIEAWKGIAAEWLEFVQRDYSHPCVIGWCPFNEITPEADYWLIKFIVDLTHSLDSTRPVLDTSGMTHKYCLSDYLDVHDYDQSPDSMRKKYAPLIKGEEIEMYNFWPVNTPFIGKPVFISEYGGMRWSNDPNAEGWGYDEGLSTVNEWLERLKGLTKAILDNPALSAFCYTQLTDIEQEINGLYTFKREPKFEPEKVSEIICMPSAYEKTE